MKEAPLVVIVGLTASGKTALAIELAELYDGEIICADSRTLYRSMDIGTAKPTASQRERVVHWGLDLVEPNQKYNVADFKRYAEDIIVQIRKRGKVPILVGGTGLYIDSIIFDYQFGMLNQSHGSIDTTNMTAEEMIKYCNKHNIELPINIKNTRHLANAIVRGGINRQRRTQPIENCIVVGIASNRKMIQDRIVDRAEQIFSDGIVEEAIELGERYGWDSEAMTGNVYPIIHDYLTQKIDLERAKQQCVDSDLSLAKRQMTWFRRNPFIAWGLTDDCRQYVSKAIAG